MAPEVFMRDYQEKCDVWACGVILYVLLCGSPPFRGCNMEELKGHILRGKYHYDGDVWNGVSDTTK